MRSKFTHKFGRGRIISRRPNTGFKPRNNKFFDPTKMVNNPVGVAAIAEEFIPVNTFAGFPISDKLKSNIIHKGYTIPTPIQDQVIPALLSGRDVVGIANTGTGKTAAFLIPLIQKITVDPEAKVLIIAPTRELASQIQEELMAFTYQMDIRSALCIGGVSMDRQIERLKRNPQFIIGTPGRIKDLGERGKIKFFQLTAIVLDEVDQMLDMGFIRDIRHIIGKLPNVRHSLFFSATLPDAVKGIMQAFLRDPVMISVKTADTLDAIHQDVIKVAGRSKFDILENMLREKEFSKVLIFGATKWKINKLERALQDNGWKVMAIHGNKTQGQRQKALQMFKNNAIQALLATDVASRGLDIDDVTHVINFDMPNSYESYIHRIGRTGRANKTGKAITLVD
ncbi:hypothetical protein A3B57_00980 [Microgenomates group bacterium RIFCSPLOWO2_01_FULL_47_10]|nr:MAG: hypothetical protein A3B57_00980 [Microgenomates group bacterium RIFCSPLOWO2_01_FULL_47_10]